jgi:putative membrane protein
MVHHDRSSEAGRCRISYPKRDVSTTPPRFDPRATTRPDPALLTYYLLVAALTLAGFPFVFTALYCKFRTLQYRFDERGVSMAWGLLFKREVYLTYRRIQDIHVTRNLFHRWLDLADVSVQTASGTAGAEMVIQGIRDPQGLRDFLYTQMRGARDDEGPASAREASAADEALVLLREILGELRARRAAAGGPGERSS